MHQRRSAVTFVTCWNTPMFLDIAAGFALATSQPVWGRKQWPCLWPDDAGGVVRWSQIQLHLPPSFYTALLWPGMLWDTSYFVLVPDGGTRYFVLLGTHREFYCTGLSRSPLKETHACQAGKKPAFDNPLHRHQKYLPHSFGHGVWHWPWRVPLISTFLELAPPIFPFIFPPIGWHACNASQTYSEREVGC